MSQLCCGSTLMPMLPAAALLLLLVNLQGSCWAGML
jgi:hypothetical protein